MPVYILFSALTLGATRPTLSEVRAELRVVRVRVIRVRVIRLVRVRVTRVRTYAPYARIGSAAAPVGKREKPLDL